MCPIACASTFSPCGNRRTHRTRPRRGPCATDARRQRAVAAASASGVSPGPLGAGELGGRRAFAPCLPALGVPVGDQHRELAEQGVNLAERVVACGSDAVNAWPRALPAHTRLHARRRSGRSSSSACRVARRERGVEAGRFYKQSCVGRDNFWRNGTRRDRESWWTRRDALRRVLTRRASSRGGPRALRASNSPRLSPRPPSCRRPRKRPGARSGGRSKRELQPPLVASRRRRAARYPRARRGGDLRRLLPAAGAVHDAGVAAGPRG